MSDREAIVGELVGTHVHSRYRRAALPASYLLKNVRLSRLVRTILPTGPIITRSDQVGLGAGIRFASDTAMSKETIENRIPHRAPMLLLDEVVSQDDRQIVCKKTFNADDFFVQGHFPGQPIVPGVIQCECCLQAGAVLLSMHADGERGSSVPVATRMDGVKFKRMVKPGDTVEIHVNLDDQVSNAYYMTGKMLLDGKVAMRLTFACSIADPSAT